MYVFMQVWSKGGNCILKFYECKTFSTEQLSACSVQCSLTIPSNHVKNNRCGSRTIFLFLFFFCFISCKTQTASKKCIENIYYVVCRFFFIHSSLYGCIVCMRCPNFIFILFIFLFVWLIYMFIFLQRAMERLCSPVPACLHGWMVTHNPGFQQFGSRSSFWSTTKDAREDYSSSTWGQFFFLFFFLTLIFFLFKHLSVHIFVIKIIYNMFALPILCFLCLLFSLQIILIFFCSCAMCCEEEKLIFFRRRQSQWIVCFGPTK